MHVRQFTHYVMDACNRVRSIILFASYSGDVIRACRGNKVDC